MLVIEALLLLVCGVLLWRQTLSRRIGGGVLLVLAAVSYFGGFLIRSSGDRLQHVELPAYFDTATITLPDGRRFALAMSLQRVQRYGADGAFELGWFVNEAAAMPTGGLSLGLTTADMIVIASSRTRQAEIYNADGQRKGGTKPFSRAVTGGSGVPPIMLPGSFAIDGVTLVNPVRAGNPRLGWATVLPGLFLHSWFTGALFWAGLNLLLPVKAMMPRQYPKTEWRAYSETPADEIQVSAWEMGGNLVRMFLAIVLAILVFIVVIAVPTIRLVAG
jgi:hypothetical protein